MSFYLTSMERSEIQECADLTWTAYDSVPDDIAHIFFPGGYTPAVRAFLHDTMLPLVSDPTVSYVLVRDTETDALVAMARWQFQTEDRSLQALDHADDAARHKRAGQKQVDGFDPVPFHDFRHAQEKCRRDIMQGMAHVKLGGLVTHPDYRRRGAGSAALSWCLRKADEMRLPVYLEATEMGRPLYKKHGFKDVMVLPFHAMQYGHRYPVVQWCMLRDASQQK